MCPVRTSQIAESGNKSDVWSWLLLTDNRHPLVSRVLVNRLWLWIYGVGLVRTADNFGTTGDKPTHPELLDYLATDFMRRGGLPRIPFAKWYYLHPIVARANLPSELLRLTQRISYSATHSQTYSSRSHARRHVGTQWRTNCARQPIHTKAGSQRRLSIHVCPQPAVSCISQCCETRYPNSTKPSTSPIQVSRPVNVRKALFHLKLWL